MENPSFDTKYCVLTILIDGCRNGISSIVDLRDTLNKEFGERVASLRQRNNIETKRISLVLDQKAFEMFEALADDVLVEKVSIDDPDANKQ